MRDREPTRTITPEERDAAVAAEESWLLTGVDERCVWCGHRDMFHVSDGDCWDHWCLVGECRCRKENLRA